MAKTAARQANRPLGTDRNAALEAEVASDYITKPVDLDHLVSMMRVWLAT